MEDLISLVLYGTTAGASLVAALSLGRKWRQAESFRAGSVTALLLMLTAICNAVGVASPYEPLWLVSLSGGASATVFVSSWIYARDLSSDVPRSLGRRDGLHFLVPVAFAAHAFWAGIVYGNGSELPTISQPGLPGLAFGFAGLILILLWVVHVTAYSAATVLTLVRLPRRLKLVFADIGGRELIWLRAITILLILHIPMALAANTGIIEIPEVLFAVLSSVIAVLFGNWSIHQLPVFQLTPQEGGRAQVQGDGDALPRYAKSLLDEHRLDHIARRIEAVFRNEQLHLTPNLSLKRLSERLAVSEGHLSQTFSRRLQCTFFDYVNRWRVDEAKRLLEDPSANIAEVGVNAGYNSRSAFYNAFREATGMTPAAYRDLPPPPQTAADVVQKM